MILQTKNKNLQNIAKERLMPVIPFTDGDLAMNDDGFFSDNQQKRLKPKTDLYIALSGIGAFVGFVLTAIFFYVGQNSDRFFLPTLVSITAFGISFYGVFWGLALSNKIKKGYGVKKVEGFAELSLTYGGKNNDIPYYRMKINGINFHLNEKTYD